MRVIVSLTSIPARNGLLDPTIASLQSQTKLPDDIRLYAPPGVAAVDGVTVVPVIDRGPLTKLSAVTDPEVADDDLIVTVDDDILYHPTWLETLVGAVVERPEAAIGRSGWNVADFLRHETQSFYIWVSQDGPCDIIEGWSGAAYRKRFFKPSILDIPDEFRIVDDVWISGYLYRHGIERRIVTPQLVTSRNLQGLHHRRDFLGTNRRAARSLFEGITYV